MAPTPAEIETNIATEAKIQPHPGPELRLSRDAAERSPDSDEGSTLELGVDTDSLGEVDATGTAVIANVGSAL